MKVFYTFGSDERFPFYGGWVEVEAPSIRLRPLASPASLPALPRLAWLQRRLRSCAVIALYEINHSCLHCSFPAFIHPLVPVL